MFNCGVKRINVSIDTLKPDLFGKLTRRGNLEKFLKGIYKAKEVGLKVKINTVALKETNEHEIIDILKWAHSHNFDMTIIETMPLGEIDYDRTDQFLPLSKVKESLEKNLHIRKKSSIIQVVLQDIMMSKKQKIELDLLPRLLITFVNYVIE